MITKFEIITYFTNIECKDCPFIDECNTLINKYDAPTLCNCVTSNFEGT